jgi:hypothetical protein
MKQMCFLRKEVLLTWREMPLSPVIPRVSECRNSKFIAGMEADIFQVFLRVLEYYDG